MNVTEIKELTTAEIIEKIGIAREELTRMKLNHAVSPLDNPQKIRATRREIAKLKTALQQCRVVESKK